jgi:hypothetical protein
MPYPDIPAFAPGGTQACSSNITQLKLSDVTQAFNEASPEDQTAFLSALGLPVVPYNLTIGEMTSAVAGVSADDLQAFATGLGPVFSQMMMDTEPPPDLRGPLAQTVTNGGLLTKVEQAAEGLGTALEWTIGLETEVLLKLAVPAEDNMGCDCEVYELKLPNCDGDTDNPAVVQIASLAIANPVNPGDTLHLGDGLQVLLNYISLAMRGSNPCGTDDWVKNVAGSDVVTTLGSVDPQEFYVQITANPNPARINWSPPEASADGGIQRFGKYKWICPDLTEIGPGFISVKNQRIPWC